MKKTRTVDLTLTFEIVRQDDDGWPWIVTLKNIEPRCGTCARPISSGQSAMRYRIQNAGTGQK